MDADAELASELPPPSAAFLLIGLAVVVFLGRRARYPVFVNEAPDDVPAARSPIAVIAHFEARDAAARALPRDSRGTVAFDHGEPAGLGQLRLGGGRPLPIRLNSTYTTIDVGRRQALRASAPALRTRVGDDDVIVSFASRRDRDAAYAALAVGTH
jgi:hypothetical protein